MTQPSNAQPFLRQPFVTGLMASICFVYVGLIAFVYGPRISDYADLFYFPLGLLLITGICAWLINSHALSDYVSFIIGHAVIASILIYEHFITIIPIVGNLAIAALILFIVTSFVFYKKTIRHSLIMGLVFGFIYSAVLLGIFFNYVMMNLGG